MLRLTLWAFMLIGFIGLMWDMPFMFWGKVVLIGLIGLLSLNKFVAEA